MAIYRLDMKTFSRSGGRNGSRATHAAAYRAGERIRDERTGALYNHSRRHDVLHKEIVLPGSLAGRGSEMSWARERQRLWNAAEHAERRRNSRVAREYTVALPHELAHEQRLRLAQAFAQEIADRHHNAVDLVLHAPRHDARNFHAHLLATTREVTPEGLGPKTAMELSDNRRRERGLGRGVDELRHLRERWATLTNEALRDANLQVRVSHLSLRAQGIEREPTVRLPLSAWYMEQAGRYSVAAERARAAHEVRMQRLRAERIAARTERSVESPPPTAAGAPRESLQEMRARALEEWQAMRRQEKERAAAIQEERAPAAELGGDKSRERSAARQEREYELER